MQNFFSKIADLVKGNTEMAQMDTHWFSESVVIDIFVMLGPRPKDVFKQYAALTGSTELPPVGGAFCTELWNQTWRDFIASNFEKSLKDHKTQIFSCHSVKNLYSEIQISIIPLFFSFLQSHIINVDGITMTKMMSKSEYYWYSCVSARFICGDAVC